MRPLSAGAARALPLSAAPRRALSSAPTGRLLAWGACALRQTGSPAGAGAFEHHGALAPAATAARGDFVAAAAAGDASGALDAAGAAWTWGAGRALGQGAGVRAAPAPRALRAPRAAFFALGEATGVLLDAAGAQAHVWGEGAEGQLGLGGPIGPKGSYHGGAQEAVVWEPRALAGEPLAAAAAARHRTLLLSRAGVVYAAGAGFHGELGAGASGVATAPASVVGLPEGDPVVAVAAGHTFTLAATASGRLFFLGLLGARGAPGALGGAGGAGGAAPAPAPPVAPLRAAVPTELALPGLPPGGARLSLAAGLHHALVTDGARLWALGAAWDGSGAGGGAPRRVALPRGVRAIARVAAGAWAAAAVDGDGRAWVAGRLGSPLVLGGEAGPSAAAALAAGRAGRGPRAPLLAALGQEDEIGEAGGADADGLVEAGGALWAPRLTRVLDAALEGRRVVDIALGSSHVVAVVA